MSWYSLVTLHIIAETVSNSLSRGHKNFLCN
uniref:Uncharacterized protein n=1 Tax=Rhizophora mucronata TaxID=61149 RepID=A0A2P2QPG5_RHIMU